MGLYDQIKIGEVFGKWEIIGTPFKKPNGNHIYYVCRCACGREKTIKGQFLLKGESLSCQTGACHKDYVDGLRHLPLARMWNQMMARCYKPETHNYRWYGARGITVCERWHKFENYLTDLKEKPDGLELDRIDNDKGYSPENTRWVTHKENIHNSRTCKP